MSPESTWGDLRAATEEGPREAAAVLLTCRANSEYEQMRRYVFDKRPTLTDPVTWAPWVDWEGVCKDSTYWYRDNASSIGAVTGFMGRDSDTTLCVHVAGTKVATIDAGSGSLLTRSANREWIAHWAALLLMPTGEHKHALEGVASRCRKPVLTLTIEALHDAARDRWTDEDHKQGWMEGLNVAARAQENDFWRLEYYDTRSTDARREWYRALQYNPEDWDAYREEWDTSYRLARPLAYDPERLRGPGLNAAVSLLEAAAGHEWALEEAAGALATCLCSGEVRSPRDSLFKIASWHKVYQGLCDDWTARILRHTLLPELFE